MLMWINDLARSPAYAPIAPGLASLRNRTTPVNIRISRTGALRQVVRKRRTPSIASDVSRPSTSM